MRGRAETRAWADTQRRAHERNWPDVDRMLSGMPPYLFRQAKLLQYDLAIRNSETGQFRDVFLGAGQVPVLSISTWLLDDLEISPGPERDSAEGHLFRAALLLAARTHVIEALHDGAAFYGTEHLALVRYLSELATLELARTVPPEAPSWQRWMSISMDELERELEMWGDDVAPGRIDDPESYLHGRWSAAMKLPALAASAFAGGDVSVTPLSEMLDQLGAAVQIRDDLATLHSDLERGRPTYPIAVIAHAAGMSLHPWPEAPVMLGAMIATDSLGTIHEAALGRLRQSRERAADLGLPTLMGYLEDAGARCEERFSIGGGIGRPPAVPPRVAPAAPPVRAAGPMRPLEPARRQALGMAQGFLLDDLSFRESWESHREGMFGADLVASRFPAGMTLELLSAHGHALGAQIDDFLAFTAANGFRYFDHPASGIDTDTVGVYLRLLRHASERDRARTDADRVLGCLERNVRDRGSIPVWISGCEDLSNSRPPVLDLGEGCGTVAAHLLLGLLSLDTADRDVLEIGALGLIDQISTVGLGANVNYPPVYALGVFHRLVLGLAARARGSELAVRAEAAHQVLLEELQQATRMRVLSAQHAALLIRACLDADRPGLVDTSWVAMVLKQQRFDGSWRGEPFFAAPNRGRSVTWYSSTVLTTAICYDALMRTWRSGDVGRLRASQ